MTDTTIDALGDHLSAEKRGDGTNMLEVSVSQLGGDSRTGALDAFGRHRVSNPSGLFDSTLQYDTQPVLFYTETSGSGTVTHLPNESSAKLEIAGSNASVIRQTRQYFKYQPGRSQQILATFVAGSTAGATKRVGYFDAANGIFLEVVGGDLYMVKRSHSSGATVNTRVAQADWNLDKMDGTGNSGITLPTVLERQNVALAYRGLHPYTSYGSRSKNAAYPVFLRLGGCDAL